MRLKHGKRSRGDCRVSKRDFRALEKLTHCLPEEMGPTGRESGCGWPLDVDGRGVTNGIRAG